MKFKEEYRISKNFSLKEYDNYMKKKPLEQLMIIKMLYENFKNQNNYCNRK